MMSESYPRTDRSSRGYAINVSEHDYGYLDSVNDPQATGHDSLMNLLTGKEM